MKLSQSTHERALSEITADLKENIDAKKKRLADQANESLADKLKLITKLWQQHQRTVRNASLDGYLNILRDACVKNMSRVLTNSPGVSRKTAREIVDFITESEK